MLLVYLFRNFHTTPGNFQELSGSGILLENPDFRWADHSSEIRNFELMMSIHSITLHRMCRYDIDVSISVCVCSVLGGYNLGDGKLLCPQYWHFLRQHFSVDIVYHIFSGKLIFLSFMLRQEEVWQLVRFTVAWWDTSRKYPNPGSVPQLLHHWLLYFLTRFRIFSNSNLLST